MCLLVPTLALALLPLCDILAVGHVLEDHILAGGPLRLVLLLEHVHGLNLYLGGDLGGGLDIAGCHVIGVG